MIHKMEIKDFNLNQIIVDISCSRFINEDGLGYPTGIKIIHKGDDITHIVGHQIYKEVSNEFFKIKNKKKLQNFKKEQKFK